MYTVAILKANMNIEQAFEQSLIELESKEFDAIREHERVLATIWAVEAEVNNGGFDQLFYPSFRT
ncbi:DMP19 family protein [Shewanella xiamenensis]|uniref:DMP19 family protein n=1 Tax=Shewanella xiamenensis TaxID=332186 RepID=UPI00217F073D|nr:DMP19 family protein [Shewanella xiamenensis]MCT8860529.1 DMP19 family protein [Shewanella xiamenensis]UWG64817.1 DMP19 family protein [Shewanella xiamenensis]